MFMRFTEDTNVVSLASRDPGCAARLQTCRDELTAEGLKHAVNPLVIIELLNGLIRSNGSHFLSDQVRFRVLDYRGQSQFLRFPGAFALDLVLGTRSAVTKLTPLDFKRWLRAVCAAESWDHLVRGVVSIDPSFRYTFGLNTDLLAEYQDTHQRFHQERMTESRQGTNLEPLSKDEWIEAILKEHGIIPTEKDIPKLAYALDAAYRHDRELLRLAAETSYKFDRESGDPTDGELLFYLADPEMRLLTHNGKIKDRVSASPQA
jgi:hypothetical protein